MFLLAGYTTAVDTSGRAACSRVDLPAAEQRRPLAAGNHICGGHLAPVLLRGSWAGGVDAAQLPEEEAMAG
jgi:hypothetical protein